MFTLRNRQGWLAFNTSAGDYYAPTFCGDVVIFRTAQEAQEAADSLNAGFVVEPV